MTHPIAINDTLEMTGPDGKVWGRLVHLGDGICNSERFVPERGATGGLTNSGNGTWVVSKAGLVLSEAQVAEWIARSNAKTEA